MLRKLNFPEEIRPMRSIVSFDGIKLNLIYSNLRLDPPVDLISLLEWRSCTLHVDEMFGTKLLLSPARPSKIIRYDLIKKKKGQIRAESFDGHLIFGILLHILASIVFVFIKKKTQ